MTDGIGILSGKRVLVAEDEWSIAKALARDFRRAGAVVYGPVPAVSEALEMIRSEQLDGAVLDVNLRGEMAYPVADLLIERRIPFVLATGYSLDALPERYKDVPKCGKPVEAEAIVAALFPA